MSLGGCLLYRNPLQQNCHSRQFRLSDRCHLTPRNRGWSHGPRNIFESFTHDVVSYVRTYSIRVTEDRVETTMGLS